MGTEMSCWEAICRIPNNLVENKYCPSQIKQIEYPYLAKQWQKIIQAHYRAKNWWSVSNSLWYSLHELCSSLLTETQRIYRNLIGHETKPGHITDIVPGHDKQEIPEMCELVSFVVHKSVQHFHAELPYKGIYQNIKNSSLMHTSELTNVHSFFLFALSCTQCFPCC